MSKLIFHIGPPKCGSSSIQAFFMEKSPCKEKVKFIYLNSSIIGHFNKGNLNPENDTKFNHFIKKLEKALNRYDAVILSNEFFFECHTSIRNISKFSSSKTIKIVGYSRKQSDFLLSSFSQWEFRELRTKNSILMVLKQHGINAAIFWGAEAFLIAAILSDFKIKLRAHNWHKEYNQIEQQCNEYGAETIAYTLPGGELKHNLIQHFCQNTELQVKPKHIQSSMQIRNLNYDIELIESIYNSPKDLKEKLKGSEHNKFLEYSSAQLGNRKIPKSDFLIDICAYVDSFYLKSNEQFCNKFDIPLTVFSPVKLIDKDEVVRLIKTEEERRLTYPDERLNTFQKVSGNIASLKFQQYYSGFTNNLALLKNLMDKIRNKIRGNYW